MAGKQIIEKEKNRIFWIRSAHQKLPVFTIPDYSLDKQGNQKIYA
jgi:hypothetical protein